MNFFPRDYNFLHPAYWFGEMDARPFALFRLGFGLLMLKEALYHLPLAELFYSDSGLLPLASLRAAGFDRPTLLAALPDTGPILLFFLFWALVALGLTAGWRTRWMTLLNFICLISVIHRNPYIVTGAEMVQAALAFWSLFIPLGAAYSLDSRRSPRPPRMFAFPGRLFHWQVALVYLFTTAIKLEGQSWPDGSAIYLALQVKLYTFPLGDWLLANAAPDVLRILTLITLFIEGAWAPLVLAPVLQPMLRALGLLAGVALHLGIGLTMNVPNFPIIMLLSYLTLLDRRWIDALEARLGWTSPPAAVNPIPAGCGGLLAAAAQGAGLGIRRGAAALLLAAIFAAILWVNLRSDSGIATLLQTPPVPTPLETGVLALGLWQNWGMFAPDPLHSDNGFLLVGTDASGTRRDLRTGLPPGEMRPRWWIGPWTRWLKFEENLANAGPESPLLPAWGAWACRSDPALRTVEIRVRTTPTVPPGQPFPPEVEHIWWSGRCGES